MKYLFLRHFRNDSEPRRLFFFEQQLSEKYRALRFGVERLDGNGEVIGDPRFMEWSKVSHGHGVHGLLKGRYDHLLDFEAWKDHVQKNWQENFFQR